jgi:DNA primase
MSVDISSYIISKFPDASPNHSGKIHTYCPFHNDSRPSFSINVDDGLFICGSSSCGVRGTFPLFYKLSENLSNWREVFDRLKETSTDFKFEDLFGAKKGFRKSDKIINEFPNQACLEPLSVVKYLADRGLDENIIREFGLQYGKGGRYGEIGEHKGISLWQTIVAPVWDIDGEYRTFQLRCISEKAYVRWKNPEESPIQDLLYGGWLISEGGYLFVVEGASDTWKVASLGGQAVGLNTKEASPGQMKRLLTLCRLYHKVPVVCLDSDAWEAAQKLYYEIEAMGLGPKIVRLETGDPGDLTHDQFQQILKELL